MICWSWGYLLYWIFMICNMISRGELNPWVIYPQILESPILVVCQLGVCLFPCLFLHFALLLFEYVFQSGQFGLGLVSHFYFYFQLLICKHSASFRRKARRQKLVPTQTIDLEVWRRRGSSQHLAVMFKVLSPAFKTTNSRRTSPDTTTTTDYHQPLPFFFSFFFQAGREPLPGFPFLVFRCGSGWRIKAQAAARVGRPGISMGKRWTESPSSNSKGNIQRWPYIESLPAQHMHS